MPAPSTTVTITDVGYIEQRTASGHVNGVEPMTPSFAQGEFLPSAIKVSYGRVTGQPWRISTVEISGGKLKKDGTPGQVRATRGYFGVDMLAEAPQWLRDFADRHKPRDT